jgi:hypothetical protein
MRLSRRAISSRSLDHLILHPCISFRVHSPPHCRHSKWHRADSWSGGPGLTDVKSSIAATRGGGRRLSVEHALIEAQPQTHHSIAIFRVKPQCASTQRGMPSLSPPGWPMIQNAHMSCVTPRPTPVEPLGATPTEPACTAPTAVHPDCMHCPTIRPPRHLGHGPRLPPSHHPFPASLGPSAP